MARLLYLLQVIDLDAEDNNVIDHVESSDADSIIEIVTGREYEQCEMLGGRDGH